jgi:hypothetical protein
MGNHFAVHGGVFDLLYDNLFIILSVAMADLGL